VKVGANGKIALRNGSASTIHLLGDIAGYHLAGTPAAPGAFASLAPARVLDTRTNLGATGPVPAGGTAHVTVLGKGGVPTTGVSAVVINVTVTSPKSNGYVTVHPDGTTAPTASNLNFTAGQTIPNLVVVKVGANGKIALRNGSASTIHLLGDIAGYHLAGTEPTWTARSVPLPSGADPDSARLLVTDCPTTTACFGVGHYTGTGGVKNIFVSTRTSTTWTSKSIGTVSEEYVWMSELACASAAFCVAPVTVSGADYGSPDRHLSVVLSGEVWSIIPMVVSGDGGLECPAAGTCHAIGDRNGIGVFSTFSNGAWSEVTVPRPPDAVQGATGDFSDLSCWAALGCAIIGGYDGVDPQTTGMVITVSSGVKAARAVPTPSGAMYGHHPDAIACWAPIACAFTGAYVDSSSKEVVSVGAVTPGAVTASRAPMPDDDVPMPPGDSPSTHRLPDIDCLDTGECFAVGLYATGGDTKPLVEAFRGGTWSVVPTSSSSGWRGELSSLSCPTTGACTAIGNSSSLGIGAVIDPTAVATIEPLPVLPGTTPDSVRLWDVSCPSSETCVAIGFQNYWERDGVDPVILERRP
ncbi:hypothetical protein, partial [Knoellia alttitudinis]